MLIGVLLQKALGMVENIDRIGWIETYIVLFFWGNIVVLNMYLYCYYLMNWIYGDGMLNDIFWFWMLK